MKDLFRTFGKGVLYTVLLPAILLFFLCYGVYCLFLYLYLSVKAIILFFMGKNLKDKLPEEVEAERLMKKMIFDPSSGKYEVPQPSIAPQAQPQISQQVMYQNVNFNPNMMGNLYAHNNQENISQPYQNNSITNAPQEENSPQEEKEEIEYEGGEVL